MVQWYGQAERGQVYLPLVPGSWNVLKMDSASELGSWSVDDIGGYKLAANRSTLWCLGELAGVGCELSSARPVDHPIYPEAAGGEPDGGWCRWPRGRDSSLSWVRHIRWHCFMYMGNWEGGYWGEDHLPSATLASQTTGVSSLNCSDRKKISKSF